MHQVRSATLQASPKGVLYAKPIIELIIEEGNLASIEKFQRFSPGTIKFATAIHTVRKYALSDAINCAS